MNNNKLFIITIFSYLIISLNLVAEIKIIENFDGTSGITWGAVPYKAQTDFFIADQGNLSCRYSITENLGTTYIFGKDLSNGYLTNLVDNDTLLGNGLCFMARGNDVVRVFISTDKHINQNAIPRHLYIQITLDTAWAWFYLPWKDFGYSFSSMDRPPLKKDVKITSLIFWPDRLKAQTSGLVEIKNLGYFYYNNENNDCDKDGIPDLQDYDADNDGYFNYIEAVFGTDSLNALSNGIPEDIIKMPDGSYTGIFITGGWSDEYLDFISRADFKPSFIAAWANHWGNSKDFYFFDRPLCEWIIREKAIPFYIWPPGNTSPPAGIEALFDTTYSLNKIIRGTYDTEINERIIEPVKDFKMPLVLDVLGEYNSTGIFNFGPKGNSMPPADSCSFLSALCDVCGRMEFCDTVSTEQMNNQYGDPLLPDGPERTRDAYIHIVDLFKNSGIDNVLFTMHAAPYNDFGNWNRLSNYYPPEQYIDWHSTSAHFGERQTCTSTLGQVIDDTYQEMLEIYPDKPVFLVEFAVHTDSLGTKDMSAIINNAFCQNIPSDYPMIKGWTFVNSDRYETDYKSTSLELDKERLNEFNQFVHCLEANENKYFNTIQTYLVNYVQEYNNCIYNKGKDWILRVYPNPVNSGNTVNIKYNSASSNFTSLKEEFRKNVYRVNFNIYNILGRRVYNKIIRGDQNSVTWQTNNQPSGIYIIRMEAGTKIRQEKVIIIK